MKVNCFTKQTKFTDTAITAMSLKIQDLQVVENYLVNVHCFMLNIQLKLNYCFIFVSYICNWAIERLQNSR